MTPIKCSDYDFIEILCMKQYEVKLMLVSSNEIKGRFNTTCYINVEGKKQEAIKGIDKQQQPLVIALSDIVRLDVLTPNALFSHLSLID
ncbi:Rho-binding antiterminator [Shewanella sp.]|uniref:Rho-binding antiterminator n=1 Tax=Shewanella sp. TaxID=50422 RepID=UPI003567EDE7